MGCLLGDVDGALVGDEDSESELSATLPPVVAVTLIVTFPIGEEESDSEMAIESELVSFTMLSSELSVALPPVVVGIAIVTFPMVTVEGFNDGLDVLEGPKDGFVEVVGPKEGFVEVEGLNVAPDSPVDGFNDGFVEVEGL